MENRHVRHNALAMTKEGHRAPETSAKGQEQQEQVPQRLALGLDGKPSRQRVTDQAITGQNARANPDGQIH